MLQMELSEFVFALVFKQKNKKAPVDAPTLKLWIYV